MSDGDRSNQHIRWKLAAGMVLGLATVGLVALAPTASARAGAGDDQNCSDFTYQEDAQAHLNADRSDPDRLDADHDGIACETNPHRPAAPPVSSPTPRAAPPVTIAAPVACAAPTDFGAAANSVARLYLAYFRRPADGDGFWYWMGRRYSGACLADVSEAFAGSPEFVATYGPLGDADFVRLVYRNVMTREPDASGQAFWVQQLASGVRRGTVMIGFSESNEFRTRSGMP